MAEDGRKAQKEFVWQRDDQFLRNVEKEVLIPKKMRDKAKILCAEHVDAFTRCCQDSGLAMALKCRKENHALKECVTNHYKNPQFFEMCKQEYLTERAEFRVTGITQKKKKLLQELSKQEQQQST